MQINIVEIKQKHIKTIFGASHDKKVFFNFFLIMDIFVIEYLHRG
jgi:hypothetical protein